VHKKKIEIVLIFVLISIVAIGYIGWHYLLQNNINNSQPYLKSKPKYLKLDSRLNQLIQSNNRGQFAQTNGLKMKDGKVQVEITTSSNSYKLPSKFGDKGSSYRNLLDAYVVIDFLPELASDPQIVAISVPSYPVEQ